MTADLAHLLAGDGGWAQGDALGLAIPADAAALQEGGAPFLTRAFQAIGALAADNRVAEITRFQDLRAGSTGRKALLSIRYDRPSPDLPAELFVKFSRDFDDAIRDRAKDQMRSEVRFALLSRQPGFPIHAPHCLFADYEDASGTGLLITERIPFGVDGVEPAHEKCLDYEVADPLAHYQVLLGSVARLAGSHKSGVLGEIAEAFPFDLDQLPTRDRIPYSAKQLQNRVARYGVFAAEHPGLLPDNIREPAFIERLSAEVPRFLEHEEAIKRFLHSQPNLIALCHWNANIDNGWFWRDADGRLQCGLLDWGRVSQMNVALAIWGSLSGAETQLWNHHLDDLLALFAAEFQASGGPPLDVADLKLNLQLFVALMGLAWLMDVPPVVRALVPDLAAVESRFDPRIKANETARTQLQMMTNFLNLWSTHDFGAVLDRFLAREAVRS